MSAPTATVGTDQGGSGVDDLVRMALGQGLGLKFRDLGRRHGEYLHAGRLITINPRRSTVVQRVTLAHELGHAHHAHAWTDDPRLHARQERLADEHAARLLISPAEYAIAEALVGEHPGALAKELGVLERVVITWRRTHARERGGAEGLDIAL